MRSGFRSAPLPVMLVFTFLLGTLAGVSAGIQHATARDLLRADGAQRIVVSPLDSKGTVGQLNTEKLEMVRSVPGVEWAVGDYVSSIRSPEGSPLPRFSLATHSWGSYVPPPITSGSVADGLGLGQVVVPSRSQGVDFTRHLGRTLRFAYSSEAEDTSPPSPDEASSEDGAEQAADIPRKPPLVSETIELEIVATYDARWHADGPETAYLSPVTAAKLASAADGKTASLLRLTNGADRIGVMVEDSHDPEVVAERLREIGLGAFPLPLRERKMIATVDTWRYVALGGLLVGAALFGVFAARRNRAEEPLPRVAGVAAVSGLAVAVPATVLGMLGALALRAPMEAFLGLRIDWWMLVPSPVWILLGMLLPALVAAAGASVSRAGRRQRSA
ncbi:hypothetical protein IL38_14580 [Actinopolyspora erythraea]|uniref:ABC transporter permease n=1 Tax=Actinopolyspora erythraea TaxID=414996 RepID=A0ABR4X2T9_9ACTN|nr:hypothetical protein IL38_14580 [Actinopolyspora erythraea]